MLNEKASETGVSQNSRPTFSMKTVAWFLFLGVLVGGIGMSFLMPSVLEWYFEPPTTVGVSCAPSIAWALEKFRLAQLVGMGAGALLGLILGWRFAKK